MIDHMLIKLGKYLRVIGYDAEWDAQLRTHELILRANNENRVFITRNTKLKDQYPNPNNVIFITSINPAEQLHYIIEKCNIDPLQYLFSKCIRCNVALCPVPDKKTVKDAVHPNVYGRHKQFYTCPSCDTVFWKGSHVDNTCRKLGIDMAGDKPIMKTT